MLEYIEYKLGRNAVSNAIKQKILPTIEQAKEKSKSSTCWALRLQCPSKFTKSIPNQVFVGLPFSRNNEFFTDVQSEISQYFNPKRFNLKFYHPSKSLSELCQMCDAIKKSEFCIVDTSYHDLSMVFALGVAFGKDKKFIQLHNTQLSSATYGRPMSDLRPWGNRVLKLAGIKERFKPKLPKG